MNKDHTDNKSENSLTSCNYPVFKVNQVEVDIMLWKEGRKCFI